MIFKKEKNLNEPKKPFSWKSTILNVLFLIFTVNIAFYINNVMEYIHVDQFIEKLELNTFDLRNSIRIGNPKTYADPRTVIVKFDDLTLNLHENEYGTWPWPRKVHAELISFMHDCGVQMMAYDLMFASPQKGQQESDEELVAAFRKYPNIYFSMNFDNNLAIYHQAGQDLTPKDVSALKPLAIPLMVMPNQNGVSSIDFYSNPAMTFNHFRPLLPDIMATGKRIAFVNHSRDMDGISRRNPLLFRFIYNRPITSDALPVKAKIDTVSKKTNGFIDQKGRRVSKEGILLNEQGKPVTQKEISYYPYLAMRMLLDIAYPNKTPQVSVTPEGYLDFGKHHVPLSKDGTYLVSWYNYNYDQEQSRKFIENNEARVLAFQAEMDNNPALKTPKNAKQLKFALDELETAKKLIADTSISPAPFPEISASHLLAAIAHKKTGQLSEQDKELIKYLKGKIIFVGTTALATYDIKSTPISPIMPGVVIQAHIFDNLLQNKGYISRLTPSTHIFIMMALSLLTAFSVFKLNSANAGFLTMAAIVIVYLIASLVLYKEYGIWINIVMPVLVTIITMVLSFMAKYISRDHAYKQTYVLATTDSMTGLYNHRYFKEHVISALEQGKRFNQKFSVVLVDIDFFKAFNDTYGHQAGDKVLQCVAQKLKSTVRSIDLVARYGGEEMAILLDRTNEQEALDVAQKLVNAVGGEAYPIANGVAKHVTISVGVSTYPTHGETVDALIEFSDQAMYRAKRDGRNQVGLQYDSAEFLAAQANLAAIEKNEKNEKNEKQLNPFRNNQSA